MNGLGRGCGRGAAGDRRNHERGLTLIELMIAMAIALMAIAGAYAVYLSQEQEFARQRVVSEMDNTARMAMNEMAKRLRLARVGSDPGTALTAACACRVSFVSSRRGTYTFLTNTSAVNNPTISVNTVNGFQVGDLVSLTDWAAWQTGTIQTIGAGTLTLNAAPSVLPHGSGVFQILTTTFALNLPTRQLMSGALVLAMNVEMDANGFPPGSLTPLFRYFDGSNNALLPAPGASDCTQQCLLPGQRRRVREVLISLSLESPRQTNLAAGTRSTVTHQTGVKLRLPSPS